jgi:hypothetical protein
VAKPIISIRIDDTQKAQVSARELGGSLEHAIEAGRAIYDRLQSGVIDSATVKGFKTGTVQRMQQEIAARAASSNKDRAATQLIAQRAATGDSDSDAMDEGEEEEEASDDGGDEEAGGEADEWAEDVRGAADDADDLH